MAAHEIGLQSQPAGITEPNEKTRSKNVLKEEFGVTLSEKKVKTNIPVKGLETSSKMLKNVLVKMEVDEGDTTGNQTAKLRSKKMLMCNVCKGSFVQSYSLKNYPRTQSSERCSTCEDCSKKMQKSQSNKAKVIRKERFFCDICGRLFLNNACLNDHKRIHSGDNLFPCDICRIKCKSKSALKLHSKIHVDDKMFACNKCDKTYKSKISYENHLKSHNDEENGEVNEQKPFLCEHCKMAFTKKENLLSHLKTHCQDRPFNCDQCDMKFESKQVLQKHLLIHGERGFLCSICQKGFVQKYFLDCHFRTHTGEKPYGCDKCERKFFYKASLNAHLKKIHSHIVEKLFACELCGAKYNRKNRLKEHMKSHRVTKDYVCRVCQKGYVMKCDLEDHFKSHIGRDTLFLQSVRNAIQETFEPNSCKICGKNFKLNSNLLLHEKGHNDFL